MLDISVLYVEDSQESREEMLVFLNLKVKKIWTAENGLQALKTFSEVKPDLIISDLDMPQMNGIEMVKEIRKENRNVPIIIVSEKCDFNYVIQAFNSGVKHFLEKPVDFSQLEACLAGYEKDIQYEKAIVKQKNLIKAILDFQENMIVLTNGKEILNVNKKFADFFGFQDLKDIDLSDFFVREEGYIYNIDGNNWLEYLLGSSNIAHKVKLLGKNRSESQIFFIQINQFEMEENYFIISFSDITELEKEKKVIEHQAETDHLTNLYNRLKFENVLSQECIRSSRYKNKLGMIMIDIDNFKKINDSYGHLAGDNVLKELVAVVNFSIRKTDIFTRWGGEEFVILATETDLPGVALFAERVRADIENHNFPEVGKVTCSLGIAEYVENEPKENFIKRADEALYRAKFYGKNRVEK